MKKENGVLSSDGAGKTILMNTIVGYLAPDYGNISIDRDVRNDQNLKLRKKLGYVGETAITIGRYRFFRKFCGANGFYGVLLFCP
ncbi:MAG: ATP-binding cassette domain-containing protein [Ignavibacteriales bacterium]|nr:ATP-binding cassette domain-containing protein [Ignavibacteriales bacterium]